MKRSFFLAAGPRLLVSHADARLNFTDLDVFPKPGDDRSTGRHGNDFFTPDYRVAALKITPGARLSVTRERARKSGLVSSSRKPRSTVWRSINRLEVRCRLIAWRTAYMSRLYTHKRR